MTSLDDNQPSEGGLTGRDLWGFLRTELRALLGRRVVYHVLVGGEALRITKLTRHGDRLSAERPDDVSLAGLAGAVDRTSAELEPAPAIIDVPADLAMFRLVEAPAAPDEELRGMLFYKLRQEMPHLGEGFWFGFREVDRREDRHLFYCAVLREDAARRFVPLVRRAGVIPVMMTIGLASMIRAEARRRKGMCAVLAHSGDRIEFGVGDEKAPVFCRGVRRHGPTESGGGVARMIADLRRGWSRIVPELRARPIVGLSCLGDHATLDAPAARVREEFGIPQDPEVTAQTAHTTSNDQRAVTVAGEFLDDGCSALELGSRTGGDFVRIGERLKPFAVRAASLVLLLVMISLCLSQAGGLLARSNASRRGLLRDNRPVFEDLRRKKARIDVVESQIAGSADALDCLLEACRIMPNEIVINEIRYSADGSVRILGQASKPHHAYDYVAALEETSHFRDVFPHHAQQQRIRDKELTRFELLFAIEKDGKGKRR